MTAVKVNDPIGGVPAWLSYKIDLHEQFMCGVCAT